MTADDVLKIALGAFFLVMFLVSQVKKARKSAGAAGAPRAAGSDGPVPLSAAPLGVPQPRVAALVTELRRRGITPPAALQAIAAAESLASPPPPQTPAAPPQAAAPAPPRPAHQRHAPRAEGIPSPAGLRPPAPAGSAAAATPARRMLAEAFGDPAHARTAVILAEILAKPVALR